jgi:preprotein translocase subunit SecD
MGINIYLAGGLGFCAVLVIVGSYYNNPGLVSNGELLGAIIIIVGLVMNFLRFATRRGRR